MAKGYKIEQLRSYEDWMVICHYTSLNDAINQFRSYVLENPDTTFRLTAYAAD